MSVRLNQSIFEDVNFKFIINVDGVDETQSVSRDDFRLELYILNKKTGQEIFHQSLGIDDATKLYQYLSAFSIIKDSEEFKTSKIIEVTDEILKLVEINDIGFSDILKRLLNTSPEKEKLEKVFSILNIVEIEDLSAALKQKMHRQSISDLESLIEIEVDETVKIQEKINKDESLAKYIAGQPEKIFQNWVEQNLWALGDDHSKKHDQTRIGLNSDSDLLLETIDGFLDLIEMKRPIVELFKFDDSHKCYYPSSELSKAIGQSNHYLKILEENKYSLEKKHSIKVLRPRIKLIIGTIDPEDDLLTESLRMLNFNLNSIDVIPFNYVIINANKMILNYTEK